MATVCSIVWCRLWALHQNVLISESLFSLRFGTLEFLDNIGAIASDRVVALDGCL